MAALTSLKGTLEGDQLFSLLSYLKLTKATGRLEVIGQGRAANLFIQDGNLIHAECGPLNGDKAVAQVAMWKDGQFAFMADERSPKSTITDSLEGLALSVAVAIDEGKYEALPVVPQVNLDLPARLAPRPPATQIVMGANEISLLAKINGKLTLREITLELDWTVEQMRVISYRLLEAGAIELASLKATQPDSLIDVRFTKALREAFTKIVGPAAQFLWEDVAADNGINPEMLVASKFGNVLRGLAGTIDDPAARDQFIKVLTQLRAQFRI
jgi:Domain of unknown function (DUF4388)